MQIAPRHHSLVHLGTAGIRSHDHPVLVRLMATFNDRERAVDRIIDWIAPDNDRDITYNHMPAKTMFGVRVYEWDYEDHDHTQQEKDETPVLVGWVDADARTVTFQVPND